MIENRFAGRPCFWAMYEGADIGIWPEHGKGLAGTEPRMNGQRWGEAPTKDRTTAPDIFIMPRLNLASYTLEGGVCSIELSRFDECEVGILNSYFNPSPACEGRVKGHKNVHPGLKIRHLSPI